MMKWIGFIAGVLILSGCQDQAANVEGSRSAAEEWVKATLPGYTMTSFSGATLDTDDDGYVTADITVSNDGGKTLYLIQLDTPTMGDPTTIQRGAGAKLRQIPYNNKFGGPGGLPAAESGSEPQASASSPTE